MIKDSLYRFYKTVVVFTETQQSWLAHICSLGCPQTEQSFIYPTQEEQETIYAPPGLHTRTNHPPHCSCSLAIMRGKTVSTQIITDGLIWWNYFFVYKLSFITIPSIIIAVNHIPEGKTKVLSAPGYLSACRIPKALGNCE